MDLTSGVHPRIQDGNDSENSFKPRHAGGKSIQFFTGGHKTLNSSILKSFSWYKNIGIILDWYHLEKRCKEQLSLALKGRSIRNEPLGEIKPLLWHGLTDEAVGHLESIGKDYRLWRGRIFVELTRPQ